MYKIILINMPFAGVDLPSIALTQLKARLDEQLKEQASVDILYLNLDFAKHFGLELYLFITGSVDAANTGLGDWFFRQAAFPEIPDNKIAYFKRYYRASDANRERLLDKLLRHREELDRFLDSLIVKYEIEKADLVGFTSIFFQNVACFAMARKIKELKPQVVTVMG